MKMFQWLLSASVSLLFVANASHAEGKRAPQSPASASRAESKKALQSATSAARGAASASTAPKAAIEASAAAEECPAATDALQLTGASPYAVHVRVNSSGIPEFWTTGATTPHTQLALEVDANQTSAQIAFTFDSGSQAITALASTTSGLTFGSVASGAQTATVLRAAGKFGGCYHFDVETALRAIDPIIIISVKP